MVRFKLLKNTREVRYKDRKVIDSGCTVMQDDQDPKPIGTFETRKQALEELRKYQSSIYAFSSPIGLLYEVTEYYIEENEYDEDGDEEFVNIWDFSQWDDEAAKLIEGWKEEDAWE